METQILKFFTRRTQHSNDPISHASATERPADLPEYKPAQGISGTIRIFGSKLSGAVKE
jgi:hypothetical protein